MSDEIQKKQIIDYTSTTTLANGDKLLLQKADGTTMNVDYTELARNIITQYNAQTLAGSAQSIQSAFAALNSNLMPLTRVETVTDLDDATGHNRIYRFNTGALNNPGYNYGFVQVWVEGNNIHQLAVPRGGTASVGMSERSRGSTGTWGEWLKIPTRPEFDALNNSLKKLRVTGVTSSSTATIVDLGVFDAYGVAFIVLRTDVTYDGTSVYVVRRNSAGYQITPIYVGSDDRTPIIDSNGVLKLKSYTSGIVVHALACPFITWS